MKRRHVQQFTIVAALSLMAAGPCFGAKKVVQAESPTFDVSLAVGRMDGETSYEIGGDVTFTGPFAYLGSDTNPFPISRLTWPLDVFTAEIGAGVELTRWLRLSGRFATNVTDDAGTMTDEDFGPIDDIGANTAADERTIFSKSDATLDMSIFDVLLQGHVYKSKNVVINIGSGYMYQKFDFDLGSFVQTYPAERPGSPYFGRQDFSPVPGIDYEASYSVPYFNLGLDWKMSDKFGVAVNLDYSPWASAEDEDHHLLRGFYSEGNTDGDFVRISFQADYHVTTDLSVNFSIGYAQFDTDGNVSAFIEPNATQLDGAYVPAELRGAHIYTQDKTIDSEQLYSVLSVGYTF